MYERSKHAILIFSLLFLVSIQSVFSTGVSYSPDPSKDILISDWDKIPFKNQRATVSWSSQVNSLSPVDGNWDTDFSDSTDISYKCLSYGASSVNDWFLIHQGYALPTYTSYVNGMTERGTNPRELEAIYHSKLNFPCPSTYCYVPKIYDYLMAFLYCESEERDKFKCTNVDKDPVTHENIPYNLRGYAEILSDPPLDWIEQPDPNLRPLVHTTRPDEYPIGAYREIEITNSRSLEDEKRLEDALVKNGIIYAFTEPTNSDINLHVMALVGYGHDGRRFFIFHDNYGEQPPADLGFSEYRKLYIEDIDQAFAFYPKADWPTYHQNYRRTGFTMLRGDLKSESEVRKTKWTLNEDHNPSAISHPSIADLDGDGEMEVIVTTSSYEEPIGGKVYAVRKKRSGFKEVWVKDIGTPIAAAPTIADVNGDGVKDVVFGTPVLMNFGTIRGDL